MLPGQIATIKATVPVIRAHGNTVTNVFYNNILRDNPSLNAVFNQGNQATGQQPRALANAVLAYAQYIETPEVLIPAVKHISNKHASLFVQPDQYIVVGQYLLDAFAEVLGDAFTPEIRSAWANAYTQLAEIMINTEKALYKSSASWTDWRSFTITSKTRESDEITSFNFTPTDNQPLPAYQPGQYISVKIHIPSLGYTQSRQYSLSDAPSSTGSQNSYRISVRREPGVSIEDTTHPGLVSNVLHATTQVGDTVELSHPMGEFVLDPQIAPEAPLVLISAGVGVTPLMSMLNYTLASTPSRPVTWIQGANSSAKRAFSRHVDTVKSEHDNVRVLRFLSEPTGQDVPGRDYEYAGRIDLKKCGAHSLHLSDPDARYYVCGPDNFMVAVKAQLAQKGVDEDRVHSERFGTGGF